MREICQYADPDVRTRRWIAQGQMGNSEVGHMNIGAGRVVHMDITRIDLLIANKQLDQVPSVPASDGAGTAEAAALCGIAERWWSALAHSASVRAAGNGQTIKSRKSVCSRVHGWARYCTEQWAGLRAAIAAEDTRTRRGEIATIVGRYYAMDRDNRWERIELAYNALVHGTAESKSNDPVAALQSSYEQGVTDEFIKPIVITKGTGPTAPPVGVIRDDDAVIFFNFRADRARQMTFALAAPDFDKFADEKRPKSLFYVAMTKYDKKWAWLQSVITPEKLEHILAQVFQELQYKNLRCAETEKYAHVTYFFNGGVEKPFGGEERILVPSPKVATYDLKPEMSAQGITDTVVKAIEKGEFDAIIMNYANADMVGHSGNLEATIKAVEAVDAGLGQIYQTMKPRGGAWIVTADHGNAETMIDPATGGPHTYHTTNPVPFLCITENEQLQLAPGGALRDIAPTMLSILGQPIPVDMTGRDLRIR